MKRVAIDGLGRIERLVLRHYLSNPPENDWVIAANDLTPIDELAYLIRYDSVHRTSTFPIEAKPDYMVLRSRKIPYAVKKIPQEFRGGRSASILC